MAHAEMLLDAKRKLSRLIGKIKYPLKDDQLNSTESKSLADILKVLTDNETIIDDSVIDTLIFNNTNMKYMNGKTIKEDYLGYAGSYIAYIERNACREGMPADLSAEIFRSKYPNGIYAILACGGYYNKDLFINPDASNDIDTVFMYCCLERVLEYISYTNTYLDDVSTKLIDVLMAQKIFSRLVKKITLDCQERSGDLKNTLDFSTDGIFAKQSFGSFINETISICSTALRESMKVDGVDDEYISGQLDILRLTLQYIYEVCCGGFYRELEITKSLRDLWENDKRDREYKEESAPYTKYLADYRIDGIYDEVLDMSSDIAEIIYNDGLSEVKIDDYDDRIKSLYTAAYSDVSFDIFKLIICEYINRELLRERIMTYGGDEYTTDFISDWCNHILTIPDAVITSEPVTEAKVPSKEDFDVDDGEPKPKPRPKGKNVRYQERSGSVIGSNIDKAFTMATDGKDVIFKQVKTAIGAIKNFIMGKEDTDTMVIEGKTFTFVGLAKRIFTSVALFNVNAIAGICLLIIQWSSSAKAKKNSKRKMLMMLEEEIKMTEEKIQDASADNNRKAKYALMRSKAELENTYKRLKYNMGAEKVGEDSPAVRELLNRSKSGGRVQANDSLRYASSMRNKYSGRRK